MDEIKIEQAKKNPEQNANVFSKLFFWFITPLLRLGFKKSLEPPDFYKVLSQDESQTLCEVLEKSWENEVNESKVKNRPAKLHNAIYSVFGRKYILLGSILVFEEFVKILQPVFMGRLIRYFRFCSTMSIESAYFYAFAFSMCALTLAVWHHPYFYHVQRIGMQIRVAVSGLIYKKILTASTSGLREMEAGKIMNLLSNDVARFDQTVIFLHYFWAAPLSLIGFVALLWYEMGPSCMAGFLGLILLVPIQGFMGRKMGQYRRQVATLSDKRIGIMNELLNGIRVIKMYAWEIPFSQLVDNIRMQEIKKLKLQAILQGFLVGLFFVTGKMIVLCALAAFVFSGNAISAEVVFVASALFNTVRVTLTLFLPFAFQFYAEYKVTTSRIEKFLLVNDREETTAKKSNRVSNGTEKHDPEKDQDQNVNAEDVKVQLINYTARWNNEKMNALENINLTIDQGQLVLIVGPVGAGKSSILYSLCGECSTVSGTIKINGKMVYVPQDPWIFSASVRQNILFGRQRLEPQRYAKVVEVCQMEKDLESLPHGDSTVVGDRGAALSGGQKARINLARALYCDADIYLLDDPLSAVDAAVGRLLFERCINGHLRDKIRILVTHQLQYLKYADYVVVMKEGKVAASGKYQDLEKLGEKFTSILRETEESYQKSAEKSARLSSNKELNRTTSQESTKSPDRTHSKKVYRRSTNEDANSTAETVIGARDDSVFSNSSLKLDQPIEKDALLQEQDNLDWKRDVQAQFEDERSSGVVNWRVYYAYFRYMGNCACVVLAFAFCVLVQIVFNFSDWWLNIWVNSEDAKKIGIFNQTSSNELYSDGVNASLDATCSLSAAKIEKNRLPDMFKSLNTYDYFYIYTIIIIGLTIGSLLRSVAFRIMLNRSSFVLHSKMFSAILKAPLLFFDRNPIGRILNRFSKDTGTMDELLSFATYDFIQGIITFLGVILMVGFLNPLIFVATAPLIGLFLYARCYYMRTARVVKRLEATTKSPVYSHVSATLSGITSIRSFGVEKFVVKDFHRHQNSHTSVYSAFLSTSRWFSLIIDWLCSIFVCIVAFMCVWSAVDQSAGSIGLTLFYAVSLLGFFQWIVRQSTEMESMMVSVERVLEYANLKPEDESALIVKPPKDWPKRGHIKFDKVKLRYSIDSEYILNDLSFEIKPAEKVGIVGRTGAGKSSILNALFRLSNIEGKITIDEIDTQTIDLYELRKKVSIIPQDPVLFIGSLRKNLDPFNEFSDDVIWNALQQVELKNVFKNSEDGLQIEMQEGGGNLSVGQRQLVCLARALLRKNKILVIDEATANVDLVTDSLIQKTIRQQFKDCTVLTIAHRLNTIMDCSRVMVMQDGRLQEMDSPALLLQKRESLFSKLVEETGPQNAMLLRNMANRALSVAEE